MAAHRKLSLIGAVGSVSALPPNNGHVATASACPVRANNGLSLRKERPPLSWSYRMRPTLRRPNVRTALTVDLGRSHRRHLLQYRAEAHAALADKRSRFR